MFLIDDNQDETRLTVKVILDVSDLNYNHPQ